MRREFLEGLPKSSGCPRFHILEGSRSFARPLVFSLSASSSSADSRSWESENARAHRLSDSSSARIHAASSRCSSSESLVAASKAFSSSSATMSRHPLDKILHQIREISDDRSSVAKQTSRLANGLELRYATVGPAKGPAIFAGRSLWGAGRLAQASIAPNSMPGCPSGDAESFGELGHGVVVQLVVFEEPLSLLAHGIIFQGMGGTSGAGSVTHVFRHCVTDVPERFSFLP